MTAIETKEKLDKIAIILTAAVILSMIVEGLDLQVPALAFPIIIKEMHVSSLISGALGTYPLIAWGLEGSPPAGGLTGSAIKLIE